MTTKKKLQEQIDKLQQQLDSMEAEKKTVFDLEIGDEYWLLDVDGYGYVYGFIWDNDNGEIEYREQGNIFLTEQEALDEARRRKILTRLKHLAGGYEFEYGEDNWSIGWDFGDNKFFVVASSIFKSQGAVYFRSTQDAQNAIDEIGEDDIKFLLGV